MGCRTGSARIVSELNASASMACQGVKCACRVSRDRHGQFIEGTFTGTFTRLMLAIYLTRCDLKRYEQLGTSYRV